MSESVSLPALGESVTEGTVTRWLKKVGDRVEVDEPLLEVSTDKVDTEIPSPIAGVVEAILVAEDETVEVGTALVTIGDGLGAAAETPNAAPSDASAESVAPPTEAPATHPQPDSDPPVESVERVESVEPMESASRPSDAAPVTPEDVAAAPAESAPAAEIPSTDAPLPAETQQTEMQQTEVPLTEAVPALAAPVESAPESPEPAETPEPEEHIGADNTDAARVEVPKTQAAEAAIAPTAASGVAAGIPDAHAGYVTPLVRKLANERGIDLDVLTGTGVGGRIRKQDVLEASSTTKSAAPPAEEVRTHVVDAPPEISALRGTTVPMSRLRKVIAERAVVSMQSSAQLTSVVEVDVTLVASLRNRVKNAFLAATGQKLSFLPFFALAATEALASNPIINATIDGDTIVYPPQENIAIAVDTERGLLTPVIRDAATLDLAGFASQIADLAARTRDNKLKPDELAGGTFTLTNTGSRGALFDTPIVFLPQSAILGTGIVAKKPVVISDASGDAIAIRSMVYLALSYDHRIVDGADAARFLVAVKHRLEGGDFEKNLGI